MKTAFVEIDMRNDFADDPRAVLPVPGTYALIGKIRVLEDKTDLIIEAMDNHDPEDPVSKEEFQKFPPHCIPGTWGAERIAGLGDYGPKVKQGFRIKKNTYDTWKGTINTDRFTGEREGDLFKDAVKLAGVFATADVVLVGGVVTGICVKAFVEGAIERGYADKLIVVSDCVANLEGVPGIQSTKELFEEWGNKGVRVQPFAAALEAIS